jgi:hypothetical protein
MAQATPESWISWLGSGEAEKSAPSCEFRDGRQRKPGHDVQAESLPPADPEALSPKDDIPADRRERDRKAAIRPSRPIGLQIAGFGH